MTDRFRSLDENWSTFIESPIKDVNEGRVTSDLAVIALAQAVEMLGLRIQYLQSMLLALAGGGMIKEPGQNTTSHNPHDFSNSRLEIKP